MVERINLVLRNELALQRPVALPGIGSLHTERRAARIESRHLLAAPRIAVVFSRREQGTPLAELIARGAGCDTAQAGQRYEHWREALLREARQGVLRIEGVGRIASDFFTPDPAFEALLNPVNESLALPRRRIARSVWPWSMLLLALASLALGLCMLSRPDEQAPQARVEQRTPLASPSGEADATARTAPLPAASRPAAEGQPFAEPVAEVAAPQPTARPQAPAVPQEPEALDASLHYVVLGVFSSPQNAARFAAQALERDSTLDLRLVRFGGKVMVSGFAAAEQQQAARFLREHLDRFPEAWIYKRKR